MTKAEIDASIDSVLQSSRFIMGENVRELEREFARYLGVKQAIGVGSGTDALSLALRVARVKDQEVLTVSFSFTSSTDGIVHNGGTPIFLDIDYESFTIDTNQIEKAITGRTKAILPVHLYGHPAEMKGILELANKHGLLVIEDAAQAHGAEYAGKKLGSLGDFGCFSFYPSKNLGAFGDAGMIVTNNPEFADELRLLREYGQRQKYSHEVIGFNSRLDELQGAVLRVKLKHLEEWNNMRRKNARAYTDLLQNLRGIVPPTERSNMKHVYHLYVLRSKARDRLKDWLFKRGISTGIHYPIPIHLQRSYVGESPRIGKQIGKLKETNSACREVISLPMFPELTEEEITYVANAVKDFCAGR